MCLSTLFSRKNPNTKSSTPVIKVAPKDEKNKHDCSICWATCDETTAKKLECNHVFHIDCIDKWFLNADTCPMCRKQEPEERNVATIKRLANVMVDNNLISQSDAVQQVGAIRDFFSGKLSYAEMRMLAG